MPLNLFITIKVILRIIIKKKIDRGDYFNEKGETLRKAFLMAPVDYKRILQGIAKTENILLLEDGKAILVQIMQQLLALQFGLLQMVSLLRLPIIKIMETT